MWQEGERLFENSPKMREATNPLRFVFVSSPKIIVGATAAAEKNFAAAAAKFRSCKILQLQNFAATKFASRPKILYTILELQNFQKI